jgi:hypothetical protein
MTGAIAAGDILVEGGTYLPDAISLQNASYPGGWDAVTNGRPAFEKQIQAEGWTLFFMAGEIKATVFGFDREKSLQAALQQLTTMVRSQRCNSIEITGVTDKSFLKVPYVSVSAHARHLQQGQVFSGNR